MAVPIGPDLHELLALFSATNAPNPSRFEFISADEMPEPYRGLLVHSHHMTVTVERFHGCPVRLRVLDERHEGDLYARLIVLEKETTSEVVLFGIVRIHLHFCRKPVRDEILARQTPLGRILIAHKVLRHIHPTAYLRITPGARLRQCFGMSRSRPVFGRLAIIVCDDEPAIELLEIVRAEPDGRQPDRDTGFGAARQIRRA